MRERANGDDPNELQTRRDVRGAACDALVGEVVTEMTIRTRGGRAGSTPLRRTQKRGREKTLNHQRAVKQSHANLFYLCNGRAVTWKSCGVFRKTALEYSTSIPRAISERFGYRSRCGPWSDF